MLTILIKFQLKHHTTPKYVLAVSMVVQKERFNMATQHTLGLSTEKGT